MGLKTLYFIVSYGLLFSLPWAARRWGGKPERRAAAALLIAAITSVGVSLPKAALYGGPDLTLSAIDASLLAFLIYLTVETDRQWLIFAAAFQTISTVAHLGMLIEPTFDRFGYNVMETFSTIPTLLALAIGIWAHARRASRA